MTNHYKVYAEYFDYGTPEEIMCEACCRPANDIHHIHGRGKGKDVISNLMALCRKHHTQAHSDISKESMQYIHNNFMAGNKKVFLR